MEAFQVIERASHPGLPLATPVSMPLNPSDPAVKKNGCSCSTPSRSQAVAKASWSRRRQSGGCHGA